MQGLVARCLTLEEILNVEVNYCIRCNYRTCSYKRAVKQFSNPKD